jgi:hypothetical protein
LFIKIAPLLVITALIRVHSCPFVAENITKSLIENFCNIKTIRL